MQAGRGSRSGSRKPSAAEVSNFEGERGVVEAQLAHGGAQVLEKKKKKKNNSPASTGKRPQKTTGWAGLKPGSMWGVGRLSSVMVSPTRVSATSFDRGGDEADLAGAELVGDDHLGA